MYNEPKEQPLQTGGGWERCALKKMELRDIPFLFILKGDTHLRTSGYELLVDKYKTKKKLRRLFQEN